MTEERKDRSEPGRPPHEPPIPELSALDPTAEADRFDDIVARITEDAGRELTRRRRTVDPLVSVAAWWRPGLRAAAAVILVSAGLLVALDGRSRDGGTAEEIAASQEEFASALGVPDALSGWVGRAEMPDPGDLVLTMGEER